MNLICSNNKESKVFNLAKSLEISSYFIDDFSNKNSEKLYRFLLDKKIDYIVLAGFLLKIPSFIISFFSSASAFFINIQFKTILKIKITFSFISNIVC